ncbi:autophagy-related protein 22-like protein [Gorgonomyces haynaldii]|nr:autophagy-related protein 22-like protein [Gorgonomyces haynaldii]
MPENKESAQTVSEIRGWYSYGFAVEGYIIAGLAIFFPIINESLAAHNAVESKDFGVPCNTTQAGYDCQVPIGAIHVPTTTLVFFATSLSVFLQFFCFVTVSSFADYGSGRKRLMLLFGYITCLLGTCTLLVVTYRLWWLGFLISMITGITSATSFVFSGSFLPLLTRNHPDVLQVRDDPDPKARARVSERVGNQLSSLAVFWSIVPSLLHLCVGILISIVFSASVWTSMGLPETYGLQIGVAFSAIWGLFVLSLYTSKKVVDRPGPPLPSKSIFFSWIKFYHTLKRASKIPQLFVFLLGWFIYADGFNTIASTAILFAQVELQASQLLLLVAGIAVPLFSGIGALFFTWLQHRIRITTRVMLIVQAGLYSLLPLYGLFFFKHTAELVPLAIYHGLLLGATQSTARVLFSEMLPSGYEAEFFGLYAVTDKGSAWIGPLVVGSIRTLAGNLRPSFWFILAQMLAPIVIFSFLDELKGKQQAMLFQEKKEPDRESIPMMDI